VEALEMVLDRSFGAKDTSSASQHQDEYRVVHEEFGRHASSLF
jgi:hypothetical protein